MLQNSAPNCIKDAESISTSFTNGEDWKKLAKQLEAEGQDTQDFLCPECQICTTLVRVKCDEFDLSDLVGL